MLPIANMEFVIRFTDLNIHVHIHHDNAEMAEQIRALTQQVGEQNSRLSKAVAEAAKLTEEEDNG